MSIVYTEVIINIFKFVVKIFFCNFKYRDIFVRYILY